VRSPRRARALGPRQWYLFRPYGHFRQNVQNVPPSHRLALKLIRAHEPRPAGPRRPTSPCHVIPTSVATSFALIGSSSAQPLHAPVARAAHPSRPSRPKTPLKPHAVSRSAHRPRPRRAPARPARPPSPPSLPRRRVRIPGNLESTEDLEGRGLHSSISQLNLSALDGIRGTRRGCVAHDKGC